MTQEEIIKTLKEIQEPLQKSPDEWLKWYLSQYPESKIDFSDRMAIYICMAQRANLDLWSLILKLEMEDGGAERG